MFPKQFRIHAILILACLFMIFFPLLNEKPDAQKAQQARAAAMAFLEQIEAGSYEESWQGAAKLMQGKVPQEEWVSNLAKTRAAAGPLVERVEKSLSYSTSAKDSPDGEYILITFDSRYQLVGSVEEYVTVMLEGDRWRVAGYFIK